MGDAPNIAVGGQNTTRPLENNHFYCRFALYWLNRTDSARWAYEWQFSVLGWNNSYRPLPALEKALADCLNAFSFHERRNYFQADGYER